MFLGQLNNTTIALVHSGVAIYTGSSGGMDVKAEEAIMAFSFAQAGASAEKYAIGGTVSYFEQNSVIRAQLSGGVTVTGGSDATQRVGCRSCAPFA